MVESSHKNAISLSQPSKFIPLKIDRNCKNECINGTCSAASDSADATAAPATGDDINNTSSNDSTSSNAGSCNINGCEDSNSCNFNCPGEEVCHLDLSQCMENNVGSRCKVSWETSSHVLVKQKLTGLSLQIDRNCKNECVNGVCTWTWDAVQLDLAWFLTLKGWNNTYMTMYETIKNHMF